MDDFDYRRAIRRIERLSLILAAAGLIGVALVRGQREAIGFGAGCALAALSFFLIKKTAFELSPSARPEDRPTQNSTAVSVAVRYVLTGAAVFGIMKYTGIGAWPVFAGLMTTVAAVIAEIFYELVSAKTD